MTLNEAYAKGELRGYRAGPPRYASDPSAMDTLICANLRCDRCGHRGLALRQYHLENETRRAHLSYRAWCCCPQCGDSSEL